VTAPTLHEENSITNIAHGPTTRSIVVGVDTHKDAHVAVALDLLGARLSDVRVPSTLAGYSQLVEWAADLGAISAIAVEGTNCYGAGLTRFVTGHGHTVVEVNRPDRALRRRRGKSDTIDAEAAARAVLSGVATAAPKASDGTVEMIRMLKTAKNSAVKARTQALNQIHAIVLTAPAALREELAELRTPALTERCASLRPGELSSPAAVARHTLRLLARRALALLAEVAGLNRQIEILAKLTAPRLIDTYGVGPDGAAALLLTAGDNPERLHSEAAFAALCGASPIPASSGKTNRHRLNRGGDRQANAALHRVVVVRLRWHQPTRDYMARRLTQGKTKAEIIRCLKRYVAREIYHVLMPPVHDTLAAAA
jgi:transposase